MMTWWHGVVPCWQPVPCKVQEVDWSLLGPESAALSTGDFWRHVGGNGLRNKISGWFWSSEKAGRHKKLPAKCHPLGQLLGLHAAKLGDLGVVVPAWQHR